MTDTPVKIELSDLPQGNTGNGSEAFTAAGKSFLPLELSIFETIVND